MEYTFLVGLSQQMASERAMDVIANNLANVSTPAFKRQSEQFQQYLENVPAPDPGTGTTSVSFVLDRGTLRDVSQGRMEATGNNLDFAISGPGYFVVQTPDGLRYTRNGHFTLDGNGQVVTEDGYPVQSDGGAITLQPQDGDLRLGPDGSLSTDLQVLGKLRIVNFADEQQLAETGSTLFDAGAQAPQAVASPSLKQGMVEKSNVEPVLEISHMIDVMRAYQSSSALTQSGEDLLKQAIEKLGAVPVA